MLIAVAVLAAAVVGAVAWWLRRNGASDGDPASGEGPGTPEPGPRRGWELLLTSEAEAAFMEGLRAYHEAGGALRVGAEQGVLSTYEPPRLISLHLLADAFAARGDAALHDPQGTVETLLERLAAAERPGVLHLRAGWLEGEVDGMDAVRFAAAVGEAVRPGGWTADARLGALQITVPGDEAGASTGDAGEDATAGEAGPGSGDRALTHVNGTPIKQLAATKAAATKAGGKAPDASAPDASAPDASAPDGGVQDGGVQDGGVQDGGVQDASAPDGGAGVGDAKAGEGGATEESVTGRSVHEANTLMLDLARVLDLYQEARAQRPDAEAQTLLRETVPRLIASSGPGVTWTRPPGPGELRTVLGSTPELR